MAAGRRLGHLLYRSLRGLVSGAYLCGLSIRLQTTGGR